MERQAYLSDALGHTPTYAPRMHDPSLKAIFDQNKTVCPALLTAMFPDRAGDPVVAAIAEDITANLTFVSYPDFLDSLRQTCLDAGRLLGQEPYAMHLGEEKKSNAWLANLAWDWLPRPHVLCQGYTEREAALAMGVRRFLYVDDGCYSGDQADRFLAQFRDTDVVGLRVVICIPYMTPRGQLLISNNIYNVATDIAKHRAIPTIRDTIGRFEAAGVPRVLVGSWCHPAWACGLLFFEHKVPDSRSLPKQLRPCILKQVTTQDELHADRNARVVLPHLAPYKRPAEYADTFPATTGRDRTPGCLVQR